MDARSITRERVVTAALGLAHTRQAQDYGSEGPGPYDDAQRELAENMLDHALAEHDGAPRSNFDDVGDFHEKFDLVNVTYAGVGDTGIFDEELFQFRFKFMYEELYEFRDGWRNGNLAEMADALVDLVYVAMGTAHLLGLPWQELWDEVQRANMSKMRASTADESARSTGRGHASDVLKGPDFVPPDVRGILERCGFTVTWAVPAEEES